MAQHQPRPQDANIDTVVHQPDPDAVPRSTWADPDSRWRNVAVLAGLALLAVISGIAAKEADESQFRWAANLGNYPAAWVLILALIGRLSQGFVQAALRSSVFFVSMCLAYYAWARYVMEFPVDRDFYLWTALAVSAVPVIATIVRWASFRQGVFAGLTLASVGALAVADGLAWQLWWAWVLNEAPDDFPLQPFQGLLSIAVALVVAGGLPRHTSTRRYALVLLLPVAVLMRSLVDRVFSVAFSMI